MTVRIGIVIPVRNRWRYTQAILQQLGEQSSQVTVSVSVIVVDDGSGDGTPEQIEQAFPEVHLLRGDGELWWTGAIALGMDYARQKLGVSHLVWLNDDITLADDCVAQLVQCCQQQEVKTLTGGIVRDRQSPNWIVFGGVVAGRPISHFRQFAEQLVQQVDTLNGNLVVLPAEIMAEIGLPDAARFRHYGGDYEYICRAKAKGYRVQLSSRLQATTDYCPADVFRYMPLWIQWYASASFQAKRQVLKSLSSCKSPHNVDHMVNSMYRNAVRIPRWRHGLFYGKKVLKLVGSTLVPRGIRRDRAWAYLKSQNVPDEIIRVVLKENSATGYAQDPVKAISV